MFPMSLKNRPKEGMLLPPCGENDDDIGKIKHLLSLCSTGWVIRAASLSLFRENHSRVKFTVSEILVDQKRCHLINEKKNLVF